MTRVLFPFVGDTVGGSHVSAMGLVENLPAEFEPLIVLHGEGPLEDYLRGRGLTWLTAPCTAVQYGSLGKEIWGMARSAFSLARFLRRHRIDIVHTNDRRSHLSWAVPARLAGAKLVWHQRTPMLGRRLKLICRLAHRRVAISRVTASNFPGPKLVVDNPIAPPHPMPDRAQSRRHLINSLELAPDTVLVGWVANWSRRKRPEYLVEIASAFSLLSTRPCCFLMFGEAQEPLRSEIAAQIRSLGLSRMIALMGPKWPIEPYIAGCDVLAATALNEGLGRTLVEAMLVGTPVVASADAGHLQVIDNGVTGVLAPAFDPVGFAKSIEQVMSNVARREELTAAAREMALSRFSVQRHAISIAEIYRDML